LFHPLKLRASSRGWKSRFFIYGINLKHMPWIKESPDV
jgi:hypothetical protein